MANYYLLAVAKVPGSKTVRGLPIHTDARSLADANRGLKWQAMGGETDVHICTPDPDLPGIMYIKGIAGLPVLLERGCLTEEAFGRMLARIWGA